jgi:predicted outer membrane protein
VVSLPTRVRPGQQDIRTQLKNLHGAQLDQAYLRAEASRHQQAIATCQQEIGNGHDPAVRALATKWAPRLQQELDWIQAAQHGRT